MNIFGAVIKVVFTVIAWVITEVVNILVYVSEDMVATFSGIWRNLRKMWNNFFYDEFDDYEREIDELESRGHRRENRHMQRRGSFEELDVLDYENNAKMSQRAKQDSKSIINLQGRSFEVEKRADMILEIERPSNQFHQQKQQTAQQHSKGAPKQQNQSHQERAESRSGGGIIQGEKRVTNIEQGREQLPQEQNDKSMQAANSHYDILMALKAGSFKVEKDHRKRINVSVVAAKLRSSAQADAAKFLKILQECREVRGLNITYALKEGDWSDRGFVELTEEIEKVVKNNKDTLQNLHILLKPDGQRGKSHAEVVFVECLNALRGMLYAMNSVEFASLKLFEITKEFDQNITGNIRFDYLKIVNGSAELAKLIAMIIMKNKKLLSIDGEMTYILQHDKAHNYAKKIKDQAIKSVQYKSHLQRVQNMLRLRREGRMYETMKRNDRIGNVYRCEIFYHAAVLSLGNQEDAKRLFVLNGHKHIVKYNARQIKRLVDAAATTDSALLLLAAVREARGLLSIDIDPNKDLLLQDEKEKFYVALQRYDNIASFTVDAAANQSLNSVFNGKLDVVSDVLIRNSGTLAKIYLGIFEITDDATKLMQDLSSARFPSLTEFGFDIKYKTKKVEVLSAFIADIGAFIERNDKISHISGILQDIMRQYDDIDIGADETLSQLGLRVKAIKEMIRVRSGSRVPVR